MITAAQSVIDMINSPVRKITARVEVYEASTLVDTFAYDDKLMSISIERACEEGKFFGFGICQRVQVQILDKEREVDYLTTKHSLKVAFGAAGEYVYTSPTFHITQSRRNENTNELTIYGYDLIYDAAALYTADLPISAPYSINDFAAVCATVLGAAGIQIQRLGETETVFTELYNGGGNFEGTETLREALNDVAEATQTIYYLDANDMLIFKRLDKDAAVDLEITKDSYISLDSSESRRLATICHATELGDNYSASTTQSGSTQYVRDNAFWTTLDNSEIANHVDTAVATVGSLTINQFTCAWRGNFLLEIGDKISLTTKDDKTVVSFVLDDMIEYNGAFQEATEWSYKEDETETDAHTSNLGEMLKQTYAKVDKVNREIELQAGNITENSSKIAALELNTESISASVQQIDTTTKGSIDAVNSDIASLTERLEATISKDEVEIKIQDIVDSGATHVATETGYTFNDDGLTIYKSDSEMKTTVTEDGMTVYKNEEAVLTANNEGVKAVNLHATTYLIIGTKSRFEDYGDGRTGCFWIG